MTRRLICILVFFMSVILAWALGFTKLPFTERNDTFWLGFVVCFAMIVIMIAVLWVWNHHKVNKFFETATRPEMGEQKQKFARNKILLSLIILALLLFCIFYYINIQRTVENLNLANIEINELKYNANLEQQRIKISLLFNLIKQLDSTTIYAQDNPNVDMMMERIVALSSSLKVHKEWDMENKVNQSISTERGLLLLAFLKTKMDSNGFKTIKENISFFGAELPNVDFHGLNLSGIDLQYANLQNANLQGTNLNYANLKGANLVGVNLNHATLVGSNLIAAKLICAKINFANLHMASLDHADLSNATLQKSILTNTSQVHTVLSNAILNDANFFNSTLFRTNFSNANLTNAVLTPAFICSINFERTILKDAIFQEDWLKKLEEFNQDAVNSILEKYKIVADTTTLQDSIILRLTPKTN